MNRKELIERVEVLREFWNKQGLTEDVKVLDEVLSEMAFFNELEKVLNQDYLIEVGINRLGQVKKLNVVPYEKKDKEYVEKKEFDEKKNMLNLENIHDKYADEIEKMAKEFTDELKKGCRTYEELHRKFRMSRNGIRYKTGKGISEELFFKVKSLLDKEMNDLPLTNRSDK